MQVIDRNGQIMRVESGTWQKHGAAYPSIPRQVGASLTHSRLVFKEQTIDERPEVAVINRKSITSLEKPPPPLVAHFNAPPPRLSFVIGECTIQRCPFIVFPGSRVRHRCQLLQDFLFSKNIIDLLFYLKGVIKRRIRSLVGSS